jgi:hypothetical protein
VVAENVETGDGATTLSVEAPPGPRNQEDVVKYMLLIFSNPDNPHFTGDELDAVGAEVEALMGELAESGEWIGGEGLADPAQAKTVKVRDGSPAITDGPFAEARSTSPATACSTARPRSGRFRSPPAGPTRARSASNCGRS